MKANAKKSRDNAKKNRKRRYTGCERIAQLERPRISMLERPRLRPLNWEPDEAEEPKPRPKFRGPSMYEDPGASVG